MRNILFGPFFFFQFERSGVGHEYSHGILLGPLEGKKYVCFVSLFSIPHESHFDGQKAENGVGRRGNFRQRISTRAWMDTKVSVFIFEWTFCCFWNGYAVPTFQSILSSIYFHMFV